jgi:hypothetical protein
MSMSRYIDADTGPEPEKARDANAASADAASADAADDAEMLTELAGIGMRLVRLVETNVEAKLAQDSAADLGRVDQIFARLSRSIRQTLALKAKLAEMRRKRGAATETEMRQSQAAEARQRWRKARVERAVAETIEAGRGDAENLLSDLYERLLDPDIEADLAMGSIGEMVAGLCDDLGIKPDREIWKDKGWYLTEGWNARLPKPEPAPPEPQEPIPIEVRRQRSLAAIEAVMAASHGIPPPWPPRPPDDG